MPQWYNNPDGPHGWVYIMYNDLLGWDKVKIGITTRDPDERAIEVTREYADDIGGIFQVRYKRYVTNCGMVESIIHKHFSQYRHIREIYAVNFNWAKNLLDGFANENFRPGREP